MAPREEVVSSAADFLRDPSVATSPIEKRIEFLKSKNLTQEEVDAALARAAEDPSLSSSPLNSFRPAQQFRGPPGGQYNNYPYNPYGQWQPPPPPEPPRRDWRDWFIMATVVGGASYGLWVLADRYIKPLVSPPTPPQLEQDKAAIDEQFNKAFALLDTLSSDTAALKEAEEQRTKRLDTTISDIESIVSELKAANQRREDDSRRMEAEIKGMKDSLPRSIDNVRDASERQLKELSTELGSLKLLMGNRMSTTSSPMTNIPKTQPANISSVSGTQLGSGVSTPLTETVAPTSASTTGINGAGKVYPSYMPSSSSVTGASTVPRPASTPLGSGAGGNKAAIPSWQMAAMKNQNQKDVNINNLNQPSVSSPGTDGAEAVAALGAA